MHGVTLDAKLRHWSRQQNSNLKPKKKHNRVGTNKILKKLVAKQWWCRSGL